MANQEKGTRTLELELEESSETHERRQTKSPNRVLAVVRRGGPRTLQRKRRSCYNAVKHGIFAGVVLEGKALRESKAAYLHLLESLRQTLMPQGALEELLVEKLAMIAWRHARLIKAETAEVLKRTDFLEADTREQQEKQSKGSHLALLELTGGLISAKNNPLILTKCLELLERLKKGLEARAFDKEYDIQLLKRVYGPLSGQEPEGFFREYLTFLILAEQSAKEGEKNLFPPEHCQELALAALREEIRQLKQYGKAREMLDSQRAALERVRQTVPVTEEFDRFLRYEGSLERAFDRALNQLERLQRLRLGHAVPPPIKVNLS